MLEVQQQLAVAVSAEQKKDVMIEQLDKVTFKLCDLNYAKFGILGVANGTSKNVGLGKFWQDLEISEAFLISLEVSFLHGSIHFFWVSKLFTKESWARISN